MITSVFGLRISPAGTHAAVDAATGQETAGYYDDEPEHAAAYLPHQCDSWVIGSGDTATVLARLHQLRAEIDAAITRLTTAATPGQAEPTEARDSA